MKPWIVLLYLLPSLALADVYQCKGHDGKISFSDQPCPHGSTSSKVDIKLPVQPKAELNPSTAPSAKSPAAPPYNRGSIPPPSNPSI